MAVTTVQTSTFVKDWKARMKHIIQQQFSTMSISDEKINRYLDGILNKRLRNPKMTMVNNYTNNIVRTDALTVIDLIREHNLIMGGGGMLYHQHANKENVLIDFIFSIMDERDNAKRDRKKFDKGTYEWLMADTTQLNKKLVINSLYGAIGYPKFALYNRYIAESVTNQGRQIICTAINTMESFLGDSNPFASASEVYNFISNAMNDYETVKDEIDLARFPLENLAERLSKRILSRSAFPVSNEYMAQITKYICSLNQKQQVFLYYKNNLKEFTLLPFMRELYKMAIDPLDSLDNCEYKAIVDDDAKTAAMAINRYYAIYVYHDHPVYDRVRKAMYTDKTVSLYTDTDSIFLSLNRMVRLIEEQIVGYDNRTDLIKYDVLVMNMLLIFINDIIGRALQTLCRFMNVTPEFAKTLQMKNEFVFLRIMFIDRKKRYISLALYQEGQLLGKGNGLPEIKGFDFMKSTTKPYLRDYFTDIAINDILRPEAINLVEVFRKVIILKQTIEDGMKKGESKFFKQANVQIVEHYKKPYSIQGYVSVQVWNAAAPNYAVELPTDVDIVPIIDLTYKKPPKPKDGVAPKNAMVKTPVESNKNIAMIAEKYPELYQNLNAAIYTNPNPLIRHMNIKTIAKPKNDEIVLPDWFTGIMNTDKVTNDALTLFLPILKCIGLAGLKTTSNSQMVSNMLQF